jgi:GMP synthase (glutamine-hydrolysing)
MILIISTCKNKFHELEFVKPIEDILKANNIKFQTKHYSQISQKDINNSNKIIISGTSLTDNEFIKSDNLKKFSWIRTYNKPILGICAGAHIIGLTFGGNLKSKKQIGMIKITFNKEFLGIKDLQEVYNLHGLYVDFKKLKDFDIYAENQCPQAIKHKKLPIYCTLFHPEIRQKEMIINFAKL